MKKSIKFILLFIFLGLLGLGFYLFVNPKKALNIVVPEIEALDNLNVNLSGDTAYSDLTLKLKNKGWFSLSLDSLMYKIRLDTALILSKTEPLRLKLSSGQEDTLHLKIAFPYKRVSEKIKQLQNQDSVDIIMRLRVVYSTIFGKASVPFRKVTSIEVPIPPKFEIEKVEYEGREKKTGFFVATIRMHNYGKAELKLSDLNYQVKMEDLLQANGKHPEEIRIQPKSDLVFKLPFKVEFKSAFKALRMVVTNNDKVNYHLTVTGFLQSDKAGPEKTPVQLEKSGIVELKK